MKISEVIIGNSSSGVLETPSLGIPTVNIGNRQEGRIICGNVINSKYKKRDIITSIRKAMKLDKNALFKNKSPFYKKNTPSKIANKIISFKCDIRKKFVDLN